MKIILKSIERFAADFHWYAFNMQRQAFVDNLEWHNRFCYEYELQNVQIELVSCKMYIPENKIE